MAKQCYQSLFFFSLSILCWTCQVDTQLDLPNAGAPYIVVLGIAQDAGYPQAACQKACCQRVWEGKAKAKMVSCLALVDPEAKQAWLFDATPSFREQWQALQRAVPGIELAGIFLTHAHIGHYTGLMQLGREVVGSKEIPVYALPRMRQFLSENGPWSQLVDLKNIVLHPLQADSTVVVGQGFQISPFLVPHRDEFSETAGFQIIGAKQRVLFIPDIDKWQKWDRDIVTLVQNHDLAFLDGTFYANGEIPGRDMSEIPHPFITESMEILSALSPADRQKVHFIHFNHTNPVLQEGSEAYQTVKEKGFHIARELQYSFGLDN